METLDFTPTTAALADLVRGTRDDQLGDATPCPEMSVGDLLDHIGGLTLAFTAAARKEQPPGGGQAHADGGNLPDHWRDAFAGRLATLADAWKDQAAYDGSTMAGPIEMPAAAAALVALNEVTVHAWDLAKGTGQDYPYDPSAAEACRGFVVQFDGPTDEGLFGPPVDVPDDASALDRLVGATGRDPRWTP